jgi:hypothetical protein
MIPVFMILVVAGMLILYSRNKMMEVNPSDFEDHPYEDVAPETHVQYKKD